MNDDFDRKFPGYSSLPPAEQDALRRVAEMRARRMKKRATAAFFRRLVRGINAAMRAFLYGKESGRTSAISTLSPWSSVARKRGGNRPSSSRIPQVR